MSVLLSQAETLRGQGASVMFLAGEELWPPKIQLPSHHLQDVIDSVPVAALVFIRLAPLLCPVGVPIVVYCRFGTFRADGQRCERTDGLEGVNLGIVGIQFEKFGDLLMQGRDHYAEIARSQCECL